MKPSVSEGLDLEGIVRAHQAEIWRYLRFLGCEPALVDDIVQETFLSILERPFEDRSHVSTAAYLRRVARNLYLMSLRKSARAPVFEDLEAADRVWSRYAREDGGENYVQTLRECFGHLKHKARESLMLRFREGLSRVQIATKLGMTENGTKSLMRRARQMLRDCVTRRMPS